VFEPENRYPLFLNNPRETLEVGRHESVHVILAGLLGAGHIPLWLNEGLAEYFELLETRARFSQVQISAPTLLMVKGMLVQDDVLDLADLINMDRDGWNANPEENYPLAEMLVYFLMDSRQGKAGLAALLQEMADNFCRPVDQIMVLENSYPGGIQRLEEDFASWVLVSGTEKYHQY
jgi:hypothetical protein